MISCCFPGPEKLLLAGSFANLPRSNPSEYSMQFLTHSRLPEMAHRLTLTATLAFLFAGTLSLQGQAPKDISGNWEGQSLCTVPSSPCHNEHVVYRISQDKGGAGHYTIGADKIVNGQQEFMGDLPCTYDPGKGYLRCLSPDVWEFKVNGDTMTGTLKLVDGTLYRKISVRKK